MSRIPWLAACAALLTAHVTVGQNAYITNAAGNHVSVIDTATNTVTATIPVGELPYGVAVTPDGSKVYVTNRDFNNVSVISTATNTVTATIGVGADPIGVAVTPDGSKVYVARYQDNAVSVISTATDTVTATIPFSNSGLTHYPPPTFPIGVAVSPDGSRVYVTNSTGNTVSVIATATNTVTATIPVAGPIGVAVTPDGSRVYVTNGENNVSVISTATNTVTATIPVGTFHVGGVAVTPDGSRVYVTNLNSNNVSVISTATNTVTATIPVGSRPYGVAVKPDGSMVYVANSDSNTVSVISTAANTVTNTVPVGTGPVAFGMFIGPALPLRVRPPASLSVTPSFGNRSSQVMTFAFDDPRGYQDLDVVNILINNFLDGRNACYLAYSRSGGVLYLVPDTGGGLQPALTLGGSGTTSNGQCSVASADSSATGSGNTLTLTLDITFTGAFAGNKLVYMAARDQAQNNSGWHPFGVWQVPGAAQTTTTAVTGITPASGSGGIALTPFTFTFSDTKGFQDLGVENILVNDSLDGRHACYLAFARSSNMLYLVNDAGDGLQLGNNLRPGNSLSYGGQLSNSQCTVTWLDNPVSTSSSTLGLTLEFAFDPSFSGNRVFYLAARDANDANNTGWQAMGIWALQ